MWDKWETQAAGKIYSKTQYGIEMRCKKKDDAVYFMHWVLVFVFIIEIFLKMKILKYKHTHRKFQACNTSDLACRLVINIYKLNQVFIESYLAN